MKEFEYVGDDAMLDARLNEKLHPCPYDWGCNGACPYKELSDRVQELENKYKELVKESNLLKIKVALGGKR